MIDMPMLSYDTLGKYTLVTSLMIVCSMVLFIFPALRAAYGFLRKVPKWALTSLLGILVIGLYLRVVVYPHLFMIYLDDYYPLEIANKALHLDFASLNPVFVANGIMFVPIFAIFGIGFKVGMAFAILLSIGSLLLFFILAYLLTKDYAISLIATALMAVLPSHIQYSFSTYNHIPTFFFLMLALCAFFSYFESKSRNWLYLCIFSILFLLEMRTEILLLVPILLAYWAYHERSRLSMMSSWTPWIVFGIGIIFLIPKFIFFNLNFLNYSLMSVPNLFDNLGRAHELLGLHPVGFILMIIGLGVAVHKRKYGLLCLSCMAIALLLLVLSMEFSQIQGARHLHFTLATLYLLLAGGVFYFIALVRNKHAKTVLLGLVLLAIVSIGIIHNASIVAVEKNHPLFYQIYFDTRLPEQAALLIPAGCTIVTTHPGKYSATTRMKAIYIEDYLTLPENHQESCYVFADDLSCTYPPEEVKERCDLIREGYDLKYLGSVDSSQIKTPDNNIWINASYYYIKP